MRGVALAVVLLAVALAPVAAQQTGLTEAMTASAEVEIPQFMDLLALKPGMTVADVGAGFGAWTARFSQALGPSGKVYANDVGAQQLAFLRERVQREKLTNVTVLEGAPGSTNLPAGCCDAILIRDAYHHLTQPADIIRSFAAALKPGGRLAVVDFPPRPNTDVPAGVPPEVVVQEVSASFTHVRTIEGWAPKSQPPMLFLALFRKP